MAGRLRGTYSKDHREAIARGLAAFHKTRAGEEQRERAAAALRTPQRQLAAYRVRHRNAPHEKRSKTKGALSAKALGRAGGRRPIVDREPDLVSRVRELHAAHPGWGRGALATAVSSIERRRPAKTKQGQQTHGLTESELRLLLSVLKQEAEG